LGNSDIPLLILESIPKKGEIPQTPGNKIPAPPAIIHQKSPDITYGAFSLAWQVEFGKIWDPKDAPIDPDFKTKVVNAQTLYANG